MLVSAAASAAVASSPMFHTTSPGDDRTSWPPEPTLVPPPPPPVLDELRRALYAVQEEEGLESTRENTSTPIRDPVLQRDSRQVHHQGPRIHAKRGVGAMAPPRIESSILVPIATNLVTRRLAFNSMSPHSVGAMRPVEPDGQVALHYTHLMILLSKCTRRIVLRIVMSGWPIWRRIVALISGRHCLRRPPSEPGLSRMT
eukprot:6206487-Pleurochrysis_carterae.AAC.1